MTGVTSAVYKKCAGPFPFPTEKKKGEKIWICLWNYAAGVSEEVIKLCFISKETSLYKEDVERNATPVTVFFSLACCEKAKCLSRGKVPEHFWGHIHTGKSASKIFSLEETFLSGTG